MFCLACVCSRLMLSSEPEWLWTCSFVLLRNQMNGKTKTSDLLLSFPIISTWGMNSLGPNSRYCGMSESASRWQSLQQNDCNLMHVSTTASSSCWMQFGKCAKKIGKTMIYVFWWKMWHLTHVLFNIEESKWYCNKTLSLRRFKITRPHIVVFYLKRHYFYKASFAFSTIFFLLFFTIWIKDIDHITPVMLKLIVLVGGQVES